jgi:carbamoyltransferase
MIVLGITFGHDAAACLLIDGQVVADVAEERFSRVKHDAGFPAAAIRYCLAHAGADSRSVDCIAIAGQYLAPGMERHFVLCEAQRATLLAARPRASRARELMLGAGSRELPLYIPRIALEAHCRFEFVEHHLAHAAAAHHTRGDASPCLVLTLDGIGDEVSIAVWRAEAGLIEPLAKWGREASLGWFYGNVTEALGWQHGDGEGTTMGLAAYGDAGQVGDRLDAFHPWLAEGQLQRPCAYGVPSYLNDHGSYHWHFDEAAQISLVADECGPAHVAARAQQIVEQQVLSLARHWLQATGLRRLACAGGLFLNVKLNQRLWHELALDEHWIHPNPGDAGLAMGAALRTWHLAFPASPPRRLEHLYLGPSFDDQAIRSLLDQRGLAYQVLDDPALCAAQLLAAGHAIGWFQGRMESGPRALGNRSILMRADQPGNKARLNAGVKFRQDFRPFCPSLLAEQRDTYLRGARAEDFMMTSFDVQPAKRDALPAVVHVDGTLRPQTVRREVNPLFHDLIGHVGDLTGESLVLNTSFNIKGEPIVCDPRQAIRCFYDTGLDALVIGHSVLLKPGVTHAGATGAP